MKLSIVASVLFASMAMAAGGGKTVCLFILHHSYPFLIQSTNIE